MDLNTVNLLAMMALTSVGATAIIRNVKAGRLSSCSSCFAVCGIKSSKKAALADNIVIFLIFTASILVLGGLL